MPLGSVIPLGVAAAGAAPDPDQWGNVHIVKILNGVVCIESAAGPRSRSIMSNFMGFRNRSIALAFVALLGPISSASAVERKYDVSHQMTIKPNVGFGGEWQAGWRYIVGEVSATYDGATDGPKTLKGQIEPFTGLGSPKSLSAAIGASSAFGESKATVTMGSGDQPFNGSINVNGYARTDPPIGHSGSAFAASKSLLIAGLKRTSSSGNISWKSVSSIFASACTSPCVEGKDPITFSLVDPVTGEDVAGTLLSIDMSISSGDGLLQWSQGALSVSSGGLLSGVFSIDQSSPFVTNPGTLSLTFENNVITQSLATGIFAGLAPSVGKSALGTFQFGEQDIGYDFGYGQLPLAVDFGFGNSGEAMVAVVPEPSVWLMTMAALGVIGGMTRRKTR